MRLIILSLLVILTSCASGRNTTKYTKYRFNDLVAEGKIVKVKEYMACHKDNDIQHESVYYNFYGMDPIDVEIYAKFIPDFKHEIHGTYSYFKYRELNGKSYSNTVSRSKAQLYSFKVVSCNMTHLLENIRRRIGNKYMDMKIPEHKITTLKIVPNQLIKDFMKGRYSLNKIKRELQFVNRVKVKDNLTLKCVNDKCKYIKERDYYSSYPINVYKVFTPQYTGGFQLHLNYGFIVDSIAYINKLPMNSPVRRMYL